MNKHRVNKLKKTPLFSGVSDDDLALIAERLDELEFKAGETVIREEEPGDAFFIIEKGKVRISASIDENDEIILSYLEAGDYFGEMALLTGDVRSATVTADEDLKLLKLKKEDFEQLINNNPLITLTLTHRLSKRLKEANKIREERERYFKQKITPSGDLGKIDVVSLLKFVEENSLTGKITLKHGEETAIFHYEKGQLLILDYQNKEEDEALDIILQWVEGKFIIEPRLYTLPGETDTEETETDSEQKEDTARSEVKVKTAKKSIKEEKEKTKKRAEETTEVREKEDKIPAEPEKIVEMYLAEKLNEFIRLVGLRDLQAALNQSFNKFEPFFSELSDFEIKVMLSPEIKLSLKNGWREKHVLLLALLLRFIVQSIQGKVFGMDFWAPLSSNIALNRWLREQGFFDYYDNASDFIKDL